MKKKKEKKRAKILCDSCMMARMQVSTRYTVPVTSRPFGLMANSKRYDSFVALHGPLFLLVLFQLVIYTTILRSERWKKKAIFHPLYTIINRFSFLILTFGFFFVSLCSSSFIVICSSLFPNICIRCGNCFTMWHNNFCFWSPNGHTQTIYFTLIKWHLK